MNREAVKKWVVRALGPIPGLLAVTALTLGGIEEGHIGLFGWQPSANGVFIAVGLFFAVLAAILRARSTTRLRSLENEMPGLRERADLGEATLLEFARAELLALRTAAGHFSSERISLYRHEHDGFTLISRCSAAPPFQEDLGRVVLPLDQGIIGEAWRKGSATVLDLPDTGIVGQEASPDWIDAQKDRFGIDPSVCSQFLMRSQTLTAFRLAEDDGEGVIVFESTLSYATEPSPGPMMRIKDLEPLVEEAGPRLIRILKASQRLDRTAVRTSLARTQGPKRHGTAV
jgi:hypothetical protein